MRTWITNTMQCFSCFSMLLLQPEIVFVQSEFLSLLIHIIIIEKHCTTESTLNRILRLIHIFVILKTCFKMIFYRTLIRNSIINIKQQNGIVWLEKKNIIYTTKFDLEFHFKQKYLFPCFKNRKWINKIK